MKKYFQFIFLIFCLQSFSQNINFDTFIEYKAVKSGLVHYFFLNSTNNNYHFSGVNHNNDKIMGSLVDKQAKKYHLYYLKNLGNTIGFEYFISDSLSKRTKHTFQNYYYEYKEEVIDSVTTKLTFFGYKNKKKKKVLRTIEVIAINNSIKYEFDFLNTITHGLFVNSNIEILTDLPTSVKIFDKKNILIEEHKLITNKVVKAQIILPKIEIN